MRRLRHPRHERPRLVAPGRLLQIAFNLAALLLIGWLGAALRSALING